MKKYIPIVLALALAGSATAFAKSPKRGVSEDQFTFESQLRILAPGVGWYYNWANVPGRGYDDGVINFTDMEFVPMCWNANYDADAIRDYVKSHPSCRYLLGFNEPNFTKQANMTPQKAAEEWTAVKALADELGLEIVAPAMNYSPNAPYQDPTKWFDEFVALVGNDAFDYVAIHNYGGLGVMKTLAGTFHERYGKPVWVTEFCYWPNEGQSDSRVEPDVQIKSMVETVEWLEKTDYIYRYAWFKATGRHENTPTVGSPCYGLIISQNGLGERKLSPQGYVYTYMSTFDTELWHQAGEDFAATDYIASKSVNLAPGAYDMCPKPIEISQFSAGAYADYQIEIPQADTYVLTLRVSGQGEPVRFDPTLVFESVDADGNGTALCQPQQFQLSGKDDVYTEAVFEFELPAGRQTLRMRDSNTFQPSGIHISTLRFDARSGVSDVLAGEKATDQTVYSIDGRKVGTETPAPGIYIRGGRKFIVK